jgi:hypothetical protein
VDALRFLETPQFAIWLLEVEMPKHVGVNYTDVLGEMRDLACLYRRRMNGDEPSRSEWYFLASTLSLARVCFEQEHDNATTAQEADEAGNAYQVANITYHLALYANVGMTLGTVLRNLLGMQSRPTRLAIEKECAS